MVRSIFLPAACAVSLIAAPASSQNLGTNAENLDCAIWAAVMTGVVEDPEAQSGLGMALSYFIGLYEAGAGTTVDAAMEQRAAQLGQADLARLGEICLPRMQDFGARLSALGQALQAKGAEAQQ